MHIMYDYYNHTMFDYYKHTMFDYYKHIMYAYWQVCVSSDFKDWTKEVRTTSTSKPHLSQQLEGNLIDRIKIQNSKN